MSGTLSINQSSTITALVAFLAGLLPAGTEVFQAEANRVAEPSAADFVVITPRGRVRLSTNRDSYADAVFTGALGGSALTVTAVTLGSLAPGQPVFDAAGQVPPGVIITALGTGTGGPGTYVVNTAATIPSGVLFGGHYDALQPIQDNYQLDFHGPDSADYVQIISTLFRDNYAAEKLAPVAAPLYAGEPLQRPFDNGEQQIEFVWSLDISLQVNPVVVVPQQFAASLNIGLINVDAAFPPGVS